jgi:hypothetical protein
MGAGIEQETFEEADYARFGKRLTQYLATLGRLLARPGFGVGPVTLGAELELFLIDGAARPLLRNQAVRAAADDPRVTLELDRFNLELNATPTLLTGRPFTALGEELRLLLGQVEEAARQHGGRVALIGILPTLRRADPAGASQRRRDPGGRQHLLPAAPAGRPRRVCTHLQRGPGGDRAGAGGLGQLAHLPRPPAVGGDPHRAVQTVR